MISYKAPPKYWIGSVPKVDDFDQPIIDVFFDAKTMAGPWAIMNPESFKRYRISRDGILGTGIGQRYERQADGRWLKTAG